MASRILTLSAFLIAVSPVAVAVAVQAGGWVVVTFKNVPVYILASRDTFIYTVRRHGHTPMDDLDGHVEARKGDVVVRGAVKPLVSAEGRQSPGAYIGDITFPEPGNWTLELTAGSGLLGDVVTLAVAVVPPAVEPPPVPLEVRGKQLFEGKGCVSCHAHQAFPGRKVANVVDLTGRQYTAETARMAIENAIRKPKANDERGMPNLGLSSAELDALAAFLAR